MIKGLDNVYHFVSNIKKSTDFYHQILGLPILDQSEHWVTLSLGGVRFGLHLSAKGSFAESAQKRAGATITLNVDDIDRAYEYFIAKGVQFLGPISKNPWGSHVSFQDPDGNLLDLRQGPSK